MKAVLCCRPGMRIAKAVALVLSTAGLALGACTWGGAESTANDCDTVDGCWQTLDQQSRTASFADSLVSGLLVDRDLNAISVAVIQDGKAKFNSVHGQAGPDRPANEMTVFRAASLGKPVFAYLVLRLVDDGILNLDSSISTFLPRPLAEYEHYRIIGTDPEHSKLTVRTLLSHQSGFPNWYRQGPVPFRTNPGEQFGYSGEGYSLLQLVVEERTGRSVEDLAQELVFEPLSMRNSSFLWEPRFDDHFAVEVPEGLMALLQESRRDAVVAGTLITNAEDYAKFIGAVMYGKGLSDETHDLFLEQQVPITSRTLFDEAGTDTIIHHETGLAWTSGWGRFESNHGPAIFHMGVDPGCENYAVVFLKPKTAFVVLSVSSGGGTVTADLGAALIGDEYSPLDWMALYER